MLVEDVARGVSAALGAGRQTGSEAGSAPRCAGVAREGRGISPVALGTAHQAFVAVKEEAVAIRRHSAGEAVERVCLASLARA